MTPRRLGIGLAAVALLALLGLALRPTGSRERPPELLAPTPLGGSQALAPTAPAEEERSPHAHEHEPSALTESPHEPKDPAHPDGEQVAVAEPPQKMDPVLASEAFLRDRYAEMTELVELQIEREAQAVDDARARGDDEEVGWRTHRLARLRERIHTLEAELEAELTLVDELGQAEAEEMSRSEESWDSGRP